MSDEAIFVAEPRTRAGKGANREVRRQGRIPGVIYGGKEPPEMISLDVPQITRAHSTGKMTSRLYQVKVNGKTQRVIPREIQVDPVYDRPVHVDFMRVVAGAKISLAIPVTFRNADQSIGIKRGGVLNIVQHEIELIVDPDNIPDHIEADLTGLDINDSLHISSITLPAGAKARDRSNFTVATIVVPSGFATEAQEAAAAAAAAPGEGEAPAEGEAAAAPAEGGDKAATATAAGGKAAAAKPADDKGKGKK